MRRNETPRPKVAPPHQEGPTLIRKRKKVFASPNYIWLVIFPIILFVFQLSAMTKQEQPKENPKWNNDPPKKSQTSKEQKVDISGATKDGSLLPLAKSLLIQPPPFDDSQIIQLADSLIKSPNTVVTGYYRVPSKFKPGKYDAWMRNMLSLQDAMVIFTEAELVDQIKALRSHALNRTVIVPLELDKLPIGTLFLKDFWQDQLDRDPEKAIHRSYQLFWIWLSKSWMTTQAIRLNIFESDLFMWSDIGCFRTGAYNSKTMILHREQVPPNEMIQMAHHQPNPPKDQELFNDKYQHKPNFYHSGSQFAAYKDTWLKFHEHFLNTIDRFLARKMIIVEDQAVLQSVCLSHPEICAYVPFSEVADNHYFGLRHVLHNGGKFRLWRHTEAIEAKKNNKA
jgi:hypothetical protein